MNTIKSMYFQIVFHPRYVDITPGYATSYFIVQNYKAKIKYNCWIKNAINISNQNNRVSI